MSSNMQKFFVAFFVVMAMLFSAPADAEIKKNSRKQIKLFVEATKKYSTSVRWNEFEMAWASIDPEYRKEHPLTDLEIERLKQIQVTGYEEKFQEILADGTIEIRAEIRVVNRHTQVERSFMNVQVWRLDADGKRWWLTTGLPDFTSKGR